VAMSRVSVQINGSRCLSAAVSILAAEIQRRHSVFAKRAEEERATLHRSCCVISHIHNCILIHRNRNMEQRLSKPRKGKNHPL
jgi:hypothetical protein